MRRLKGLKITKHLLIPLLLLLSGGLIFFYAGWNLFKETHLVGKLMFSKPLVQLTEKKFIINDIPMYRPKAGSDIGKIIIPSIDLNYPLINGDDDEDLSKGVGHDLGTALPGEKENVVVTGHRDTVFRNLGKVKTGDLITLQTYYGDFKYKVTGTRVVKETDETVIVKAGKEMLTLYTCYPFEYIGNPKERYVVTCDFVEVTGNKELKVEGGK
jgi:sortase A